MIITRLDLTVNTVPFTAQQLRIGKARKGQAALFIEHFHYKETQCALHLKRDIKHYVTQWYNSKNNKKIYLDNAYPQYLHKHTNSVHQ